VNAITQHRLNTELCCCHWDFVNWVRLQDHPECSVHGTDAVAQKAIEQKRVKLLHDRIAAQENLVTMQGDLVVLPARIASCKRLLERLNEQLKELGR
jgi:hypothetical protein